MERENENKCRVRGKKGKWQVHNSGVHVHVIQMLMVGKKTHSTLHMCLNIQVKRAHDAYKTPAQLLGVIIFDRKKHKTMYE